MGKLICPLCGVSTSPTPLLFKAKVLRKVDTIDLEVGLVSEDGLAQAVTPPEPGQPIYGIIVCQACGKRFVAEEHAGEWSAVYPIRHSPVAEEIPEPIKSEFEEAHLCFAVKAYRGCLLMCRTTLIALQREQEVSNLKELQGKDTISSLLCRQADQVRLWANMIGHEDMPEAIAPEDAEQLLTYLEALLDAVYIQPRKLSCLAQKHEQLKKG